jgi:hypothetical protein
MALQASDIRPSLKRQMASASNASTGTDSLESTRGTSIRWAFSQSRASKAVKAWSNPEFPIWDDLRSSLDPIQYHTGWRHYEPAYM